MSTETLAQSSPGVAPAPAHARKRERPRMPLWRIVILVMAAIFFIGPLLASVKYSLIQANGHYGLQNYRQIVSSHQIRSSLMTSLEIAAIAAVLVVALVLPTVVLVRLRFPKLTLVLEGITVLPIVIPPVVIAAGLEQLQTSAPSWLVRLYFNHPLTALTPIYVVLALPFTYRALDNGVRAIDLRTLVDASRNLGGSWPVTLTRVILPNVQAAALGAMFLTVALCLGEVVIASLLLYSTLPPVMITVSQKSPGISVALSLLSLLFTFLLLFILSHAGSRRRGSTQVSVI